MPADLNAVLAFSREGYYKTSFNLFDTLESLTYPGFLRMADLFFYTRGIPLYRLSPLFLGPFQFLETRWRWPGRFGYLLTWIACKPGSSPSPR